LPFSSLLVHGRYSDEEQFDSHVYNVAELASVTAEPGSGGAVTIVLKGRNFYDISVAYLNGIPLATTLFKYGIGGTLTGVILAVLVPMVPLAIFILMPFFEQISINLEWSASVMGASRFQIFRRILLPLALPGLLTAGILILVNTVSNFELAFLVSGAGSQTLVVALFYNVFAGGVRPVYSVDAMAVMYMTMVMLLLIVALRFVRPTQMVFRLDQPRR